MLKSSVWQTLAESGIRRHQPAPLKESADCFNDSRGKRRRPPLDFAASLPLGYLP